MPKRIPTPPPADDEPRYLTVVHPFVLDGHCNMELPKDRQDFARWVACCIDAKYLYAFFHKPSARDMVIIEVARECPQLDRLLGEHRWCEFLRNPTEQERDQVSKVFYCTYSTGRQVQKNGWKRIFVEDIWFSTWSTNNHFIAFPYPETHFCDVPIEDQTNHPICRPLPGTVKPPPPVVLAAPVPGSIEWHSRKQLPAPIAKRAAGAWANGTPKPVGNAWKAAIATSSPAIFGVKKKPAVGGGTITVKASDVWVGLPVPPANGPNGWVDSPAGSGRNTPGHNTSSPSPVASQNQPPDVSPGISGKRAWNAGPSHFARPPGIPAVPNIETAPSLDRDNISSASWNSSGRSSSISTDIVLTPESAPEDPYRVHITISDSMERALDGLSIDDYSAEDEIDPNLAELDSIAPGNWDEPTSAQTWSEYPAGEATWDDAPVDAESLWKDLQESKETEKPIICNAHGVICKKGICREYSKQFREAERAKNEAVAIPKKNRGRGRGGAFGRGGGRGSADRDGTPANAFRGPGAPVKTNWRGAPRAIVSAAAIEEMENVKDADSVAETSNAWGNTSNALWEPAANDVPAPSEDGWGKSVAGYDPWATVPVKPKSQPKTQSQQRNPKPQPKTQPQPQRNPQPKPQPMPQPQPQRDLTINAKTTKKPTWAEQMDAFSDAGHPENDGYSTVSSRRGGAAKAHRSSTSGWGTVDERPW